MGNQSSSTPLQKKSELEQEKIEQIIEKIVKFRTLNLSNNSLSHIPEALIKSIEGVTATFKKKKKKIVVKDISFTNNKFVKWPVDFLTKMSALNILEVTELNAQFCALQDIECDWAKLFPTIERVYLFANYIRSIPDSLGKCENLVTIDIRSNPCIRPKDEFLPFLTDYNLCRIKNLTTLKISSCYDFIKNDKDDSGDEDKLYVPLSLLEIHQESLTTLDLSFNNIISFCGRPKKPICMKSLTELSLILNEITTLESTVFNGEVLPVLKTLRLSNNKLTELPDEFCSINSLEKLFIDHNNLASLPKNFGNLKKLIHLDLGSNCIKELPESFQNLRELFVLDLKSNQIESVSNQILENLCELSDLFLSGNKLSNETFSLKIMGKHMKNLNILNLGFNNFTSIHEIFEFEDEEKGELCLPNIKQLILTGNKLTSFPDQLTKRSSLSILHLAHNRLKTLPENFFQNLKNIQKLSLCGNQLDNRVLPSDSLLTEKATILDLSHNNFDFSKVDLGKLNPLFLEGRKHFSRDFQIDFNNNEEESLTEANEFILSGVAHTIGRRPNMEDTYIINKNIDTGSSDLRFQLYGIFDGHGGMLTSQYVSENFCSILANELKDKLNLRSKNNMSQQDFEIYVLKAALETTDKAITTQGYTDGCTAAILLIINETRCIAANIGDARIVLVRKDKEGIKGERISKDHKPALLSEKKRVRDAGSYVHENRVNGIAVSRSIGDHSHKGPISSEPYIHSFKIDLDKHKYIILGCDGVWDVVDDQAAAENVDENWNNVNSLNLSPQRKITLVSAILRDYAFALQSSDNISTMVLKINENYNKKEAI